MDIEWFTNGRVGFLLKDNICTVSSRGLYFMCDAVKAYKLLDYKFVYVGKNKENKNIVAKFTNVENKFATAYSISASNKQANNLIECGDLSIIGSKKQGKDISRFLNDDEF